MLFQEIFFIYFLPLSLIPLIIAIILNINKSKIRFPSIEIIENIIKNESLTKKIFMKLKNIIRMLIIIFIILSYAKPDFKGQIDNNEYILFIDPTLSMSRVNILNEINKLKENYKIEKIYFGDELFNPEKHDFVFYDANNSYLINNILLKETNKNFIIFTDGQKNNWKDIDIRTKIDNLKIYFINKKNDERNIYVNDFNYYPYVAFPGTKIEFIINIGGVIDKNDRIKIYFDNQEVFNESVKSKIEFSRFITSEKKGIIYGEIHLDGDNFTNDNVYYFLVNVINKPNILINIENSLINKILNTIFPVYNRVNNQLFADIIITDYSILKLTNKLIFLFCEDYQRLHQTLQRLFNIYPELNSKNLTGNVNSQYDVLNFIKDAQIKIKFLLSDKIYRTNALVKVNEIPILYCIDNYYVFNFSIIENQDYLWNSVFLLLTFNEILMRYYHDKMFEDYYKYLNNKTKLIDKEGNIINNINKPGIYFDNINNKYIIANVRNESVWNFYDKKEFERLLMKNSIKKLSFIDIKNEKKSGIVSLSNIFIYLSLILLFLTLFV